MATKTPKRPLRALRAKPRPYVTPAPVPPTPRTRFIVQDSNLEILGTVRIPASANGSEDAAFEAARVRFGDRARWVDAWAEAHSARRAQAAAQDRDERRASLFATSQRSRSYRA
jgi:hypothetical protein